MVTFIVTRHILAVILVDVEHPGAAFGIVITDPNLTKLEVIALELTMFNLDDNCEQSLTLLLLPG